ncbi:MAG: hypothetical protein O7B25_16050, partial [Gammaproteobacteria bacterium]|nr:hypothetical protein [Gammaproteobacteria bacterium]
MLLVVTVGLIPFVASLQAAEAKPAGAAPAESNKLISLADVAPELIWAAKRRLGFYGDANTIKSTDVFKRSYLLGDLNGLRDYMTDNGVFIGGSVTQFLAGNLTGGLRTSPSPRGNGSGDLWVILDSGRMGLWSGGLLYIRGEAQWSTSVNGDVGTLLPANLDAVTPSPTGGNEVALPEVYIVQALPKNFAVTIGKVNWASFADTNFFANSENSQFIYTGLVNNPMLGAFIPYTALSAGLTWVSPNKKHTIGALFSQTDGTATSPGFDTLFNGANTYAGFYNFSSAIDGRPGNFQILLNYTTKNVASFAIDRRHLIKQVIGVVPVTRKENNYGVMINIDQYL